MLTYSSRGTMFSEVRYGTASQGTCRARRGTFRLSSLQNDVAASRHSTGDTRNTWVKLYYLTVIHDGIVATKITDTLLLIPRLSFLLDSTLQQDGTESRRPGR